ncbi:MAG: KAP family P-loop NTPase fold protein [Sulfitobacter sp.]
MGFKERADAFTNLITSIDDHRTISIEAGYGRGKTFFRERWARQLKAAGECVVQIDARLSDHSGDPVVTFLGALLGLVPEKDTKKREAVYSAGKKILIAGGKALGKAALREGFEELADLAASEDGEASALHDIAKAAGQDLSKAAGELIASQLSAENARLELNEQLKALHAQITEGRETDRIIILIDELDRCHPDYAIALLEAMKLVFDQDGFVFVLMVNREYLENIATHRFGGMVKGEFYLDKFVDLRLKLEAGEDELSEAVRVLASNLPLEIPFGDHPEFSIERAGQLAGRLAPISGLSMRQISRLIDRVELTCRIYKDRPIDAALLVWLAYKEASASKLGEFKVAASGQRKVLALPRATLDPLEAQKRILNFPKLDTFKQEAWARHQEGELFEEFPEFEHLNLSAFRSPDNKNYYRFVRVYKHLAPHYIPEHQAMLDAVHKLQVDP